MGRSPSLNASGSRGQASARKSRSPAPGPRSALKAASGPLPYSPRMSLRASQQNSSANTNYDDAQPQRDLFPGPKARSTNKWDDPARVQELQDTLTLEQIETIDAQNRELLVLRKEALRSSDIIASLQERVQAQNAEIEVARCGRNNEAALLREAAELLSSTEADRAAAVQDAAAARAETEEVIERGVASLEDAKQTIAQLSADLDAASAKAAGFAAQTEAALESKRQLDGLLRESAQTNAELDSKLAAQHILAANLVKAGTDSTVQLTAAREESQAVREEMAALERSLRAALQEQQASQAAADLQAQQALARQADAAAASLRAAEENLTIVEGDRDSLRKQIQFLDNFSQDQERALRTATDEASAAREALAAATAQLEQGAHDAQAVTAHHAEETEALRTQLGEAQVDLANAQAKVTSLFYKRTSLEDRISALEASERTLQSSLSTEMQRSQEESAALSAQLASVQADLAAALARATASALEAGSAEQQRRELELQLQAATLQARTATQQQHEAETRLLAVQAARAEMDHELADKLARTAGGDTTTTPVKGSGQIQSAVQQSLQAIASLTQQKAALEEQVARLEEQQAASREAVAQLTSSHEVELAARSAQLQQLQREGQELQAALAEAQSHGLDEAGKLRVVRSELQTTVAQLTTARSDLAANKAIVAALSGDIKAIESSRKGLETQLHATQTALSDAESAALVETTRLTALLASAERAAEASAGAESQSAALSAQLASVQADLTAALARAAASALEAGSAEQQRRELELQLQAATLQARTSDQQRQEMEHELEHKLSIAAASSPGSPIKSSKKIQLAVQQYQDTVADLGQQRTLLEDKIAHLEAQVAQQASLKQALETKHRALQAQVRAQEEELALLREASAAHDARIADFERQLEEAGGDRTSQHLSGIRAAELFAEKEELQKQLEASRAACARLEEEKYALDVSASAAVAAMEEKSQTEAYEASARVRALEEQLQRQGLELAGMQHDSALLLGREGAAAQALQAELSDLRASHESVSAELAQARALMQQHSSSALALEAQLQQSSADLALALSSVASLESAQDPFGSSPVTSPKLRGTSDLAREARESEMTPASAREKELRANIATLEAARAALEIDISALREADAARRAREAENRRLHEEALAGREQDADFLLVHLIDTRLALSDREYELDAVKQRLKGLVRAAHASAPVKAADAGDKRKEGKPAVKSIMDRTASLFSSFSLDSSFRDDAPPKRAAGGKKNSAP